VSRTPQPHLPRGPNQHEPNPTSTCHGTARGAQAPPSPHLRHHVLPGNLGLQPQQRVPERPDVMQHLQAGVDVAGVAEVAQADGAVGGLRVFGGGVGRGRWDGVCVSGGGGLATVQAGCCLQHHCRKAHAGCTAVFTRVWKCSARCCPAYNTASGRYMQRAPTRSERCCVKAPKRKAHAPRAAACLGRCPARSAQLGASETTQSS